MNDLVQELFNFIKMSPTSSHTAATVKGMLTQAGFQELKEGEPWRLQEGGKYFLTRGMAALAAFKLPRRDFTGFSIAAPHGDSPCFRVKAQPDLQV